MISLHLIQTITSLLSHWRVYTEMSSNAQLNDINIVNEELSGKVLNVVYSWGLENLNSVKANYPAIDLGDLGNKIGVSVTATNTAAYIHEKIDTNIKHKVYVDYPNHHFFITTKKSNYTARFDTKGNYVFNKDIHIIDMDDLLKAIRTLNTADQNKVLTILQNEVFKLKNNFIEDITPQDIARILTEFHSQQEDLIRSISSSIEELHRTSVLDKNRINNLSEQYFEYIQSESLPFFDQIRDFLESVQNKKFKRIYSTVVNDLQSIILPRRNEFEKFDNVFKLIEEDCLRISPLMTDDRRILRILLHFMYFQCDLGASK